jgi:hypothetical protein
LGLTLIGFFLSFGGTVWKQYKHEMSVIGTIIAGIGLAISLAAPDLPGFVGFLDETTSSFMFGWALNDVVGG